VCSGRGTVRATSYLFQQAKWVLDGAIVRTDVAHVEVDVDDAQIELRRLFLHRFTSALRFAWLFSIFFLVQNTTSKVKDMTL
jgi:hypothetical protein